MQAGLSFSGGFPAKLEKTSLSSQCKSIFSDLNNLEVITTTSEKYAKYFGFTEQEVFEALDDMGLGGEKQGVKHWYDGLENIRKYGFAFEGKRCLIG